MRNNVKEFVEKCGDIIAEFEKDNFIDDIEALEINGDEYNNEPVESPIEQILYSAIKTLQKLNYIKDSEPEEINGKYYIFGLEINPQVKIGKYRVDFEITYYGLVQRQYGSNKLLIECDSQEWHERTEKERRYEKKRDRYLASKEYKFFHYTGKEIMEKSFEIGKEILVFLSSRIIGLPE